MALFGELNKPTRVIKYTPIDSDTIEIIIDNEEYTIEAKLLDSFIDSLKEDIKRDLEHQLGVVRKLDDLEDVELIALVDGQILEWDGVNFTNSSRLNILEQRVNDSKVSISFETEQQLEDWLNGSFIRPDGITPEDLAIGNNIYIVKMDERDFWVKELPVTNIDDLEVLNQDKIDLEDYARKDWVSANFVDKTAISGGITGQVLTKKSDNDLDVEWADEAKGLIENDKSGYIYIRAPYDRNWSTLNGLHMKNQGNQAIKIIVKIPGRANRIFTLGKGQTQNYSWRFDFGLKLDKGEVITIEPYETSPGFQDLEIYLTGKDFTDSIYKIKFGKGIKWKSPQGYPYDPIIPVTGELKEVELEDLHLSNITGNSFSGMRKLESFKHRGTRGNNPNLEGRYEMGVWVGARAFKDTSKLTKVDLKPYQLDEEAFQGSSLEKLNTTIIYSMWSSSLNETYISELKLPKLIELKIQTPILMRYLRKLEIPKVDLNRDNIQNISLISIYTPLEELTLGTNQRDIDQWYNNPSSSKLFENVKLNKLTIVEVEGPNQRTYEEIKEAFLLAGGTFTESAYIVPNMQVMNEPTNPKDVIRLEDLTNITISGGVF